MHLWDGAKFCNLCISGMGLNFAIYASLGWGCDLRISGDGLMIIKAEYSGRDKYHTTGRRASQFAFRPEQNGTSAATYINNYR